MDTLKIVFIPNLPYTYRDHERFGVKYFIDKGYDVEVLDIHKILIPGYKEKVKIDYYTFNLHIELESKLALLDKIKHLKSNDFIFFYIAGKNGIELLDDMRNVTKAKFITYVSGSIPISTEPCGFVDNLKLFIHKFIIKKGFSTDYYVSGSQKDEKAHSNLIGKNTKIIESHSRDYNLCLNTKGYEYDKSYCVFLDTDAIDASDYMLLNKDYKIDKEKYIDKITTFFKLIEKYFDLEVIIAAHPKSRVYKDINQLNGIRVVHGKSVNLVKNSEFILNEGTTAISYAIFFNKPSLFFTLKEISFFKHTCSFTKALNKKIINIDKPLEIKKEDIEDELKNMGLYDKYKKDYLTYTDDMTNTFDTINGLFEKYDK